MNKRITGAPPYENILDQLNQLPGVIGISPAMEEVISLIRRLAPSDITVLIQGESGTGKELVARSLHALGPRCHKPFVALNLAAVPVHLIESELFGHVPSAFEGARYRRPGRFEQADGGTLYLDGIGELPLETQIHMLRVLQDGEFFPLGAIEPVRFDVRIIAASRQSLETLVASKSFCEELYHHLNVIRLRLPPLRERREDIAPLLRHFLDSAARELKCSAKVLSPEAEAFLCHMDWGGNVRELENTCRRITVMVDSQEVGLDDLSYELLDPQNHQQPVTKNWEEYFERWVDQRLRLGNDNVARDAIRSAEGILIRAALRMARGKKQDAAKLLGYGRNTLSRKLAELPPIDRVITGSKTAD